MPRHSSLGTTSSAEGHSSTLSTELSDGVAEFLPVAFRHYHRTVRDLIIHWLMSGIALLIVTKLLPGIEVDSFGSALIAALVIGLASATVGLVLKLIFLPFIILTLGLVYLLINGLMLKFASALVPGFRVNGCAPAILGSVLLTIVDYALNRLAGL